VHLIEAHGAHIPAIGLGTWELRGQVCQSIVERALRMGYRHVDTAHFYENEREVGEGVRASGLKREEVFVTTKVSGTDLAPPELERSAKDSLTSLRFAEVDLLLLHWPNPSVPLAETLGALGKMKTMGLTRHIGISNFTVALMEEAARLSDEPLVNNQIEYHPYLDQSKVIAACQRHAMAVTAFCPIARGGVSDADVMKRIAKAHGKSAVQVSLRWLFQQNVVSIPRTTKLERLKENFAIFDFELSRTEMGEITGLARPDGRLVNFSWAPTWD
jgi:diketogulonate reductase-like aldo/keto reductase